MESATAMEKESQNAAKALEEIQLVKITLLLYSSFWHEQITSTYVLYHE
tara:strand:- start:330 stop:476 length:147 start_codon:yes stop_codon:yes gene_type:complete